jgi:hypothetical protein
MINIRTDSAIEKGIGTLNSDAITEVGFVEFPELLFVRLTHAPLDILYPGGH